MPAVCCIWWMVCLQMRIAAAATILAGCDSGSPGNAGGFTLSVPHLGPLHTDLTLHALQLVDAPSQPMA